MIPFSKYQGTGNDFVMIDQRTKQYIQKKDTPLIHKICDRRFGVGADGLILLQNKKGYDFEMIYFNADGRESSMCGNGGRCISAFAKQLGIVKSKCHFLAIDGDHEAILKKDDWVELKMTNVKDIEIGEDYYLMDTGSPHYVVFVKDIDDINVHENGQAIRYSERFRKEGVNVNFVEPTSKNIIVATYERGVEAETLSCGTGVTAAAIAHYLKTPNHSKKQNISIQAKGGTLAVRFEPKGKTRAENVWLGGKAELVFEGKII
ncbi:MAG: diaminopimelate epimerase [Bacteroidota bacterium]